MNQSGMSESPQNASSGRPSSRFSTTCWTQVMASHGDSTLAMAALSDLCNDYYEPVLSFIRFSERDPDRVRDLAHAFFAHVLDGHAFDGADPTRGRFRSYLLGAVKHFLAQHRSKAKRIRRGGDAQFVAIDETEELKDPTIPPDDLFDRRWATTVLSRALDALELECKETDPGDLFQHIRPWLTGDTTHGNQADLAEQLQMKANTLKSHVSRLRKRFRHLVREEVARTLANPAQVDEEMQALLAVLRKK
jgi:RNA polymerase sigma factor (sigma-70 family)